MAMVLETPPVAKPKGPTLEEVQDFAKQEYLRSETQAMRYAAITTTPGKVRAITLHPAPEVQTARQLTRAWLVVLRRCSQTRAMLKGEEVRLSEGSNGATLYSADLSKATDPISHRLGRFVGKLLNRLCGLDETWDEVVDKLFGPKLTSWGHTLRGLHMGLGPSWCVLAVLNMFAASESGASRFSSAICGDDLVGLWTSVQRERYNDALRTLGLVLNRTKSFIAPRGVFCEQLVVMCGPHEAVATDLGHYGHIFAARSAENHHRSRWSVAANLPKQGLPKRLAESTRRLLTRGPPKGGRVEWGGNGGGSISLGGLKVLAQKGPLALARTKYGRGNELPRHAPTLPSHIIDKVKLASNQEQTGGDDLTSADLLVYLQTAFEMERRWLGGDVTRVQERLTQTQHAKRSRQSQKTTSLAAVRQAVKSAELSSKQRSTATWLLAKLPSSKSKNSSSRIRNRIARVLAQPRPTSYVPLDVARELVHEIWPLKIERSNTSPPACNTRGGQSSLSETKPSSSGGMLRS
jgi:hypothetical protein